MAWVSRFMAHLCGSACGLAAVLSQAEPSVPPVPYTVEVLAGCPSQPADDATFTVFDGKTNLLVGWNHASKKAEFSTLAFKPEAYNIDASRLLASDDCSDAKVFQAILVKKLGTWQGSHINGIEPILDRANILFGDVESVVLELKLVAPKSHLPDRSAYHQLFSFAASPEQLETIDRQQYNFGITLFGEGYQDQSSPTVNSQTLIALDPKALSGQWLRITMPVVSMQSYTEQNYAPTAILLSDHAAEKVIGLRINPETESGKVVRHLNNEAWASEGQPEMFKEMAIELRTVALKLKR